MLIQVKILEKENQNKVYGEINILNLFRNYR
jgi:hypothetical protein